ncbi:WD40 repeat-like protein [Dichomitus squalens LYAD-421 SS1]|uniref:WD40 repeat-like protein n=1 Tax=Dichomitus squalens (strain LYAD-421) TaxID=732165 RepID=UPI0004410BAC|nr:WD40 repeat-like protein [Dichomitus squalens LYAD-421 SS1]EJF62930.1 WD40 repeat-like protein [Dichomitus squalens LYAD-421 SS1]
MSGAEHVYASAATNRYSQAADVVGHGLVAFGSGKLVGLWDAAWKSFGAHQAHKTGIASLSVLEKIAVTGASDATVKVWKIPDNENGKFSCKNSLYEDKPSEIQSINLKRGYPISLALSYLPGTTCERTRTYACTATILAIGSTDRNVYLWTRSEDNFVSAAALPGHEDWVKCLAFKPPGSDAGPLVLSSGSQDATVRLWNIEPFSQTALSASESTSGETDDLLDAFEASLVNLEDAEDGGRSISLKRHILTVKSAPGNSQLFSVTFDALLIGHEAGVTSLSWRPQQSDSSVPTLLSTSTDSSLILWSPSTVLTSSNDGTTLWINRQRFGDVGGQRLGGFVGGLWAVNGRDTMAWGWNDTAENHLEEWTEVGAITGHRAPIRSIAWSPRGEYLISASLDQTTRIHGAIPAHSQTIKPAVWHEIARPQVHGYDLIAAAFLDTLRFVSIADEKVARVFEAPREFVEIVNNLGIAQLDSGEARPRAAAVPPLGLSNKALTDASAVAEVNTAFDSSRTHRRPFEGELAAVTLWPEIEKVFGHGYESIALAVSNDKQYIATACKATTAEHAVVRVYDTRTWQLFGQPLAGHSLTVTQIAFSPDDKLVLSVSRDRTWRLFEKSEGLADGYVPVAADKSHSRIIWDCAWAPDGDTFVTASRDKTVKVWKRPDESGQKWEAASTIQAGAAATAVAFAPESSQSKSMKLAIGLESGEILIYTSTRDTPTQWTKALTIGTRLAHIDHIHRLAWRPGKRETHQLASCGEDGTLKLLTVHIAAE